MSKKLGPDEDLLTSAENIEIGNEQACKHYKYPGLDTLHPTEQVMQLVNTITARIWGINFYDAHAIAKAIAIPVSEYVDQCLQPLLVRIENLEQQK